MKAYNTAAVLEPYHFVRSRGSILTSFALIICFGTLPFRKVKGRGGHFHKRKREVLEPYHFVRSRGPEDISYEFLFVLEPYHFVRSRGEKSKIMEELKVLEPYHFVRSRGVNFLSTATTPRFGTLPFRKVKGR